MFLKVNSNKTRINNKTFKTSRKWLTVAIFRNWQDSSVALWIEIAVILEIDPGDMVWYGL